MAANQTSFAPDWTAAPGRTIRRIMTRRGLSVYELATEIDVSEAKAEALIEGNVLIDKELAERLSAALGSSSSFWIRRESDYRNDLRRLQSTESRSEALDQSWAKSFPIRDMQKFGWLPAAVTKSNCDQILRDFFAVGSIQAWQQRFAPTTALAAFRTSPTFESNPAAVTAWLRWAEIQSDTIQTRDWNPGRLATNLSQMRALTRRNHPRKFIPELKRLCADSGIALVIAPAPTGCRASGATRFLSTKKALVVLSLRYKSDDHFWFTFFHEIGHLALHAKDALFLEDGSEISSKEEDEANKFAEEVLIPADHRQRLQDLRLRSEDITRLSVRLGISSGIVVGQLQHLGRLGRNQMNHLKRRYSWKEFTTSVSL
ncbi:ImmA/IrrE family metallo-endopeptidase [Rhizobium laguerreae]|uniref:ImmA/IrrE family metallo-endopeptidase n=1 Tax=Rhizobium laguerreae TaxID=1076926 RepID=UPI001C91B092|nr:ImmA/IrrE family metallo-endopeptidase [Rhizobium laguerreae]MBY3504010.1 ImmA/IrrE family metallo-endopeptidase [Rhizobium laguerreae]